MSGGLAASIFRNSAFLPAYSFLDKVWSCPPQAMPSRMQELHCGWRSSHLTLRNLQLRQPALVLLKAALDLASVDESPASSAASVAAAGVVAVATAGVEELTEVSAAAEVPIDVAAG